MRQCCRVLIVALFIGLLPSYAVILDNATGTGDDTPASYPISQMSNVGLVINQGTGIYLGNYGGQYWVLTADHVGANDFTVNGSTYSYVPGSWVQLHNPDTSATDLGVFRINTDPGLPTLTLASSSPSNGTAIYMQGLGYNRDTGLETWNSSWVLGGVPTAHSGYSYGTTGFSNRWGTNTIAGSLLINDGFGNIQSLYSTFTNSGGNTNEAGGATGDSGGAFWDSSGNLEGVMLAVDSFLGQPGGTIVYGNSTYAADISFYRSVILSTIPEPDTWLLVAIAGLLLGGCELKRRAKACVPVRVDLSDKQWRR